MKTIMLARPPVIPFVLLGVCLAGGVGCTDQVAPVGTSLPASSSSTPAPNGSSPSVVRSTTALSPTPADQAVAPCSSTATPVTTNVNLIAAGGGTLAYASGGALFVLPATQRSPVRLELGRAHSQQPQVLAVDGGLVAYSTWPTTGAPNDPATQVVTVVDSTTGATTTFGPTASISDVALAGAHVFWWTSDATWVDWTLWNAPSDGSAAPLALVQTQDGGGLFPDGEGIAWVESDVLWTLSDATGAPTKDLAVPSVASLSLDGSNVYEGLADRVVAQPLGGGPSTPIATMLPPNYPSTGAASPAGLAQVAVGPHGLYWAECWGNGGAAPDGSGAALVNYVVRTVPRTGGAPRVVDSFTWSPQSATFGTCPIVAADGAAVYFTHEGTLMRMCD